MPYENSACDLCCAGQSARFVEFSPRLQAYGDFIGGMKTDRGKSEPGYSVMGKYEEEMATEDKEPSEDTRRNMETRSGYGVRGSIGSVYAYTSLLISKARFSNSKAWARTSSNASG